MPKPQKKKFNKCFKELYLGWGLLLTSLLSFSSLISFEGWRSKKFHAIISVIENQWYHSDLLTFAQLIILFGFSISKFEFFPPKLIIVGSQKFTNSITGYFFLSLNVIQNGLNHVKMSQKAAAKIFARQIIYLIFDFHITNSWCKIEKPQLY